MYEQKTQEKKCVKIILKINFKRHYLNYIKLKCSSFFFKLDDSK